MYSSLFCLNMDLSSQPMYSEIGGEDAKVLFRSYLPFREAMPQE